MPLIIKRYRPICVRSFAIYRCNISYKRMNRKLTIKSKRLIETVMEKSFIVALKKDLPAFVIQAGHTDIEKLFLLFYEFD